MNNLSTDVKQNINQQINIDTLAKDKIISNFGQELMDLDLISRNITRVYIFLLILGFLMFMSVIISII